MAGVLAAQQTAERPPQTAPQQTPAPAPTTQFAAGVDVVQVDVSVTDKSGQPITDLTARDFDIREDGQPQTIQTIYLATLDRTILKADAGRARVPGTHGQRAGAPRAEAARLHLRPGHDAPVCGRIHAEP